MSIVLIIEALLGNYNFNSLTYYISFRKKKKHFLQYGKILTHIRGNTYGLKLKLKKLSISIIIYLPKMC